MKGSPVKSSAVERLYDQDFFAWTQDAAFKIRHRNFNDVDIEALAEEIEDLGKRDLKEVNSRLTVILIHLLKLDYQSGKKTDSWINSIGRERTELELIFEQSPSLSRKGRETLELTYSRAARDAARETKFSKSTFPAKCPYTWEQVLDHEYYPSIE